MQSEEDWDDGEDWDEDYDDSESSSLLDMELATKMKIAGAVGIALLIILSSTIFTNFGFYSGAGSISVLIDVNEGKDASDNTFTFNILATSPAFGSLAKEGDYTITNIPNSVDYSGGSISAFSGSFSLNDEGRGSVSVAYSDLFKMNGKYNLEVELGSQKATDSVILNKFSETLTKLGFNHDLFDKDELKKRLGTNFYNFGLYTKGGILLHPGKLVRAMVDALSDNVELLENSQLNEWSKNNDTIVCKFNNNKIKTYPKWDLKLSEILKEASLYNSWFTLKNLRLSLKNWAIELKKVKIENWLSGYNIHKNNSKTVAIIMAGNIPIVGFHDLLSSSQYTDSISFMSSILLTRLLVFEFFETVKLHVLKIRFNEGSNCWK